MALSSGSPRRDTADRCLRIDEVVRTIVAWLGLLCRVSGESRRWSSLLSVALTCRMLYEAAMDTLWGEAGSLHSLIRCLPEGVLEYRRDPDTGHEKLAVRRPPLTSEWSRFQHHARRFERLIVAFQRRSAFELVDQAWWHLFHGCPIEPGGSLFPRLKFLRLVGTDSGFAGYSLLLTATIRRLQLGRMETESMVTIFRFVCERCSNLSSIELILGLRLPKDALEHFMDVICAQTQLQKLRSNHPLRFTRKALLHLSHLPSITMFAVEVTSENCPTFPTTPLGSFGPALTRVIVGCGLHKVSLCVSLLNALPVTIVSLQLQLSVEEPMDNLSPLFQALSRLRGLQELGLLRLDEEYPHSGEYPPSMYMHGDVLSPLRTLPHLSMFSLFNFPAIYCSEVLHDLARAWPRLMCLSLRGPDTQDPTHDGVKLEDLLYFVKNCPELMTIEISVAPVQDGWSRNQTEPLPHSVAKRVTLSDVTVATPVHDQFASFIAEVFALASVDVYDNNLNKLIREKQERVKAAQSHLHGQELVHRADAAQNKWRNLRESVPDEMMW